MIVIGTSRKACVVNVAVTSIPERPCWIASPRISQHAPPLPVVAREKTCTFKLPQSLRTPGKDFVASYGSIRWATPLDIAVNDLQMKIEWTSVQ